MLPLGQIDPALIRSTFTPTVAQSVLNMPQRPSTIDVEQGKKVEEQSEGGRSAGRRRRPSSGASTGGASAGGASTGGASTGGASTGGGGVERETKRPGLLLLSSQLTDIK